MEFFCKPVYCRTIRGIKLNRYPNFLCRDALLDAYSLSVGSQYHIDELRYGSIGTLFESVSLPMVTLKEFPGELFLRSGFSE